MGKSFSPTFLHFPTCISSSFFFFFSFFFRGNFPPWKTFQQPNTRPMILKHNQVHVFLKITFQGNAHNQNDRLELKFKLKAPKTFLSPSLSFRSPVIILGIFFFFFLTVFSLSRFQFKLRLCLFFQRHNWTMINEGSRLCFLTFSLPQLDIFMTPKSLTLRRYFKNSFFLSIFSLVAFFPGFSPFLNISLFVSYTCENIS